MNRVCAVVACALITLAGAGCGTAGPSRLTPEQEATIRREVLATLHDAYDVSRPGVVDRMLSLYPDSGRVVSASGGQVMTTRDSLAAGIREFWNNVGKNMRQPRWIWTHAFVDVLSADAAVVTATYRVPHLTPANHPHEIGGAMTEVFQRRGDRWVVIQEHLSDLPIQASDTTMTGMPSMPGAQH